MDSNILYDDCRKLREYSFGAMVRKINKSFRQMDDLNKQNFIKRFLDDYDNERNMILSVFQKLDSEQKLEFAKQFVQIPNIEKDKKTCDAFLNQPFDHTNKVFDILLKQEENIQVLAVRLIQNFDVSFPNKINNETSLTKPVSSVMRKVIEKENVALVAELLNKTNMSEAENKALISELADALDIYWPKDQINELCKTIVESRYKKDGYYSMVLMDHATLYCTDISVLNEIKYPEQRCEQSRIPYLLNNIARRGYLVEEIAEFAKTLIEDELHEKNINGYAKLMRTITSHGKGFDLLEKFGEEKLVDTYDMLVEKALKENLSVYSVTLPFQKKELPVNSNGEHLTVPIKSIKNITFDKMKTMNYETSKLMVATLDTKDGPIKIEKGKGSLHEWDNTFVIFDEEKMFTSFNLEAYQEYVREHGPIELNKQEFEQEFSRE